MVIWMSQRVVQPAYASVTSRGVSLLGIIRHFLPTTVLTDGFFSTSEPSHEGYHRALCKEAYLQLVAMYPNT